MSVGVVKLIAALIVSPVGIVALFAFAKFADSRFRDSPGRDRAD
jgi:hypothetical protein